MAYQKREDTTEALAAIPVLRLSDINPDAAWYEVFEQEADGVPQYYHKEFTNNIIYMNYWFDLRVLPQDMIPYAALLTELLGKLDAGIYDYEKLDKALNINTGGFNAFLNVFLPNQALKRKLPEKQALSWRTLRKS